MPLLAAPAAGLGPAPTTASRPGGTQRGGDEGGTRGHVAVQLVPGQVLSEPGPVFPHGGGLHGREVAEGGHGDDLTAADGPEGIGLDA